LLLVHPLLCAATLVVPRRHYTKVISAHANPVATFVIEPVPTRVVPVDTILSTLQRTENALLRQPFFAAPQTRTIPRIIAWVEKIIAAKSVTPIQTELLAAFATYPSPDEAVRDIAVRLLRDTGLLRLEALTDIDSCAEFLGTWQVDGRSPVLTDDAIATALATVPGGLELLNDLPSPNDLRTELALRHFGPEQLGHELLQEMLSRRGYAPGALDAANRILLDTSRYLGPLLNAISRTMGDEEHAQVEHLRNLLGSANPIAVLVAPALRTIRTQVAAYLTEEPPGVSQQVRSDLLAVFYPGAHYMRTDRNYDGSHVLMNLVYDEMIASSLLAYEKYDAPHNTQRVATALDCYEFDVHKLRSYARLYRLCRTSALARTPQEKLYEEPEQFATLAGAFSAIEDLATSRELKSGTRYVLPTREEFAQSLPDWRDPVASLEMQTGKSYETLIAHLATHKGYVVPHTSAPHRAMSHLVRRVLSGNLIEEPREEYKEPGVFALMSIDVYAHVCYNVDGSLLPLTSELCFEADGAQHFADVAYFQNTNTKRLDAAKAQAVLDVAATRPMALVALHHRVLTGPRALLLGESDLATLAQYVTKQALPWVFVRPVGSTDMRTTPKKHKPVLLPGILENHRLEVYALPRVY
jgi:hypothetical protein